MGAITALIACLGGGTEPTFCEDIAPLLVQSCVPCHRAGESAPFPLLTYADASRRARQLAEVVAARQMPPWLPSGEPGHFKHDRRLSAAEIATIVRWAELGAPEGDRAKLPPAPEFPAGWALGEPDLVLTMEADFVLPPEGTDVYRNFVLPVPLESTRYVEALELRPGSQRVVHHALVRVDRTNSSRAADALDPEPGFDGMEMGLSEAPDGQFVGWTPGRQPQRAEPGTAWILRPGTDLVVQLHLVPSGKPEPVRISVGLHFTDTPPTRKSLILRLRDDDLEIPAGEAHYRVEDELVLPVATTILKLYPHAHYLGKRIEAFGELPDGARLELLTIEDWDFNWQDEYQFERPPTQPAGTRLVMRYEFDNSADNPRNPSLPPRTVHFGNRSSDEMATLTLQVQTAGAEERGALVEASCRHRVEKHPEAWLSRLNLGAILAERGQLEEAEVHLRAGLALQPEVVDLHRNLGGVLALERKFDEAHAEFERALQLAPGNPEVHTGLAQLAQLQGRWDEVVQHEQAVLVASPRDARAHRALAQALLRLRRRDEARAAFERAFTLEPRDAESAFQLGRLALEDQRLEDATRYYLAGLAVQPVAEAHADLARVYEARGLPREAAAQREAAQKLGPKRR